MIAGRLGLDHDRVLFSKFGLVILARLMHNEGGQLPDAATQSKVLAWYAHAGMWGRYAGSTETLLTQDLDAVDAKGGDGLLEAIRQSRGDLTIRDSDFAGSTLGSRFYPTLYMLTRTHGAEDFGSGVALSASLLGHLSSLDVHHIFPKAQLYAKGYERFDVNAVANFLQALGKLQLPTSDVDPAATTAIVRVTLTATSAGSGVRFDEGWLFNQTIGRLIGPVRCGTGTASSGGPARRLFYEPPSVDTPRPTIRIGHAANRSDAFYPPSLGGWQLPEFPAGRVNILSVTSNALGASVSARYFPTWHSHAAS